MSRSESSFSDLGKDPMPKQKIVVIGAGPVGALAAIYAAQRGHDVSVYELRNGENGCGVLNTSDPVE